MPPVSLFYRESGNPQGATLLLLHGGGVSSRMWQENLSAWPEFHCFAPDLPGHGHSAAIQPFDLETSVAGLVHLLDGQARQGPVNVVGFSVGAVVALALAAEHPQRVARLFLSGPTPPLSQAALRMFNGMAWPLLGLLGKPLRARLVAASLGLTPGQAQVLREDLDALHMGLVTQINAVIAAQTELHFAPVPTLITVGVREIGPTQRRARELMQMLDTEAGYLVADVGHAWNLEAPTCFAQTVRAWMADDPLPAQLTPLID